MDIYLSVFTLKQYYSMILRLSWNKMKIQKKNTTLSEHFQNPIEKYAERGQIFFYNMIRFYGDVVHKE